MGLASALSVCGAAVEQFPDDAEVRFYHAVARDQFAERGGTQDDNLFATETYRALADDGLGVAQYALGTMFDESSGVSTGDALSYMERARDGEFGQSIRCEAIRTFGQADLDGNGASYDVAAAEQASRGNYVCAGYLTGMYWSGYAAADDLPLRVADYARYAAVHGDPNSMAMVGLFYTYGTGSTDIDFQLQGQYEARQDAQRAGYWLLLAYWATRSSMRSDVHSDFWEGLHLQSAEVVEAMQTALTALDLYEGDLDGNFLPPTEQALAAFEASDIDAVFQMVRAKEKYDPSLGPREPLRIGSAAIPAGD
ncbi:sel1 repeat family protein [Devosia oryziradicis]|uniref:Sel1 repeat family protein n=1 Tax=Devosia oryziradicis TaxID=2801335 RepID=A0ABX7BTW5_9HYPH|nr:sel1 repeat family protein [Devosia oryziradicis]QQR35371.1 sel1 repeat family protein [Devosia oryziradicis]